MTQRSWCAIQHVSFEGPGLITAEAERRGLPLTVCHTYAGDPLPATADLDGLIVMGGPMSVDDVDAHPHLANELTLLASCVEAGTPVLGVCLGCQLLARAVGGRVYRGARPEIGPGSVTLTVEGRSDRVLSAAYDPLGLSVVHWHHDTFELPPGATRLASSDLYENQAFRVGERAYGFQFHVEVDRGLAEEWASRLPDGVEIDETTRAAIERAGRRVIQAFFDQAQRGR